MIASLNIDPGRPVLIAGPTASGKSALALAIAEKWDGIVINADALQVYDCWQVLTARPDPGELARAPHALYGHVGRQRAYSVGAWLRDVARVLADNGQKLPIVVGGTGLYISAIVNGLSDIPEIPVEVRETAEHLRNKHGFQHLLKALAANDPATAARIDTQNPVRVQRAWEVWRATGHGLAHWQEVRPVPLLARADCNAFLIDAPKEWLNPRIARRFREMLENGALAECEAARENWNPALPSSRAIGARELMAYLDGDRDLATAISDAEIATRQYAKRQRSWFRARMTDWTRVPPPAE